MNIDVKKEKQVGKSFRLCAMQTFMVGHMRQMNEQRLPKRVMMWNSPCIRE